MRFRSGRGSADCRIRIAGSRRMDPPNRRPPQACSRARVPREPPHHGRVRGFEHDAQVLQHGRVRGQLDIPRSHRHRVGVLVRVEAHPHTCRGSSTTISADSSTMCPASAAPSISDGASNDAVATPSTTRQSVPISVMPGTVLPIPDVPSTPLSGQCRVLVGSPSVDEEPLQLSPPIRYALVTCGASAQDTSTPIGGHGLLGALCADC